MVVTANLSDLKGTTTTQLREAGPSQGSWVYEGSEVVPEVSLNGSDRLTTKDPEVRFAADTYGLGLEAALALMDWMHEAETAISVTRAAHNNTFSGSEFVFHNDGTVELVLWVVGEGEGELATLQNMLDPSDIGIVSVAEAPVSELALIEELERTAELRPLELGAQSRSDVHGSLDFKSGLFIPESLDQIATLELDGHDQCTHGTGGWLEGGRRLRLAATATHYDQSDGCQPGTTTCTSGFAARLDGYEGVLTAGHCVDAYSTGFRNTSEMYANGTELFVSLRVHVWDSLPDDDAGFVREVYSSASPYGRIYLSPTFGWRNINGLLPGPAPDNAIRCIKSASHNDLGNPPDHDLGYRCGSVEPGDGNYCHFGWCRYTKVTNEDWDDFPRPGSSGGSWFVSTSAAGTHTDSLTDAGIYYRLSAAANALPGLEVYCGGTSPTICDWP